MANAIKLDSPYLPIEEYAQRQLIDLEDAELLVAANELPIKKPLRYEKNRFVNMVTLSRIRLCKQFKLHPHQLKELAMQITIQPDTPILPTEELARRWNVSSNSIRNMIREGKLPVVVRNGAKGKHYVNMATLWQHAIEDSERPENNHFFTSF